MPRGMESPRAHTKVRSSHRGYDCYLRGRHDDDQGSTRCVLRLNRLPAGVDSEMRDALPGELLWPYRGHTCTHEMIDCIYRLDVRMLEEYRRQYPNHVFGFEKFINWACMRLDKTGKAVRSATFESPPTNRKPLASDHLTAIILGSCVADLHILRYHDGDAWGQLTLRHDRTILARTFIELRSDVHHLVACHPGRFKAYGVPLKVLELAVNRVGGSRLIRPQTPTHIEPAR